MLGTKHTFADIKQDNVILTALKKSEDGDALLFRFYEWAGQTGDVQVTVPKGATAAQLTNLMEQPEGSPIQITNTDQVSVPVHPYEIVSLRVSYKPEKGKTTDGN
jgi:alpha-mannosidase